MSDTLGLVQIGSTCEYPLDTLRAQVSEKFSGFQVRTLQPLEEPREAYDSLRDQYHSTRILALLEEFVATIRVDKLLGVTPFDLYVPGMNFVFGEARCPGRVAVISTSRLKTASVNKLNLFGERVVKEAVHETGHMFGLKHCSEPSCVMYFSERLADTDTKQSNFCRDCGLKLKWVEVE